MPNSQIYLLPSTGVELPTPKEFEALPYTPFVMCASLQTFDPQPYFVPGNKPNACTRCSSGVLSTCLWLVSIQISLLLAKNQHIYARMVHRSIFEQKFLYYCLLETYDNVHLHLQTFCGCTNKLLVSNID